MMEFSFSIKTLNICSPLYYVKDGTISIAPSGEADLHIPQSDQITVFDQKLNSLFSGYAVKALTGCSDSYKIEEGRYLFAQFVGDEKKMMTKALDDILDYSKERKISVNSKSFVYRRIREDGNLVHQIFVRAE